MESLSGLTPEELEVAKKAIKKSKDQASNSSDVSVGDVGTPGKKIVRLDQVPGSIGLSYYQAKTNYRNRIMMKVEGGENNK